MSSTQVHAILISNHHAHSPPQFIDVVNCSTNNVERQVPVLSGSYSVHPGMLNEHNKQSRHNRSGVVGTQKQATSSNEAELSTPSWKRKGNIFAPRRKPEVKDLDKDTLWHNLSPTIHEDLGDKSSSLTFASELRSTTAQRQASEGNKVFVKKEPITQPYGYTNAPGLFQSPKRSQSPVDDWKLGNTLGALLKSNPNPLFTSADKPVPVSTKSKNSGKQTPIPSSFTSNNPSSHLSLCSFPMTGIEQSRARPAATKDKTVFTKPSPPPTPLRHNSPESRRTPSPSTATDRSSPAFTDPGSSAFSLDEQSMYSPATTPPLSPVIPINIGRAHLEYTPPLSPVVSASGVRADALPGPSGTDLAQSEDTPFYGGMSNELSMELFGEEPAETPKQVTASSLFDAGVTVAPRESAPARVFKRRSGPVEELPSMRPKEKKTRKKRAYNKTPITLRRTKVEPALPRVFVAKQTSVSCGRPETNSGLSRGTKRAPSPLSPTVVQPSKRAKVVSPKALPKPYKFATWEADLTTLESLVFDGKQGPGQIGWVLRLVKDLSVNAEVIPAKWVRKELRIRESTTLKGTYQHKNKRQLLEDVVNGYASCDEEGKVAAQVRALLIKWGGSSNILSFISLGFVVVLSCAEEKRVGGQRVGVEERCVWVLCGATSSRQLSFLL
ncbi:hypothetical protein C8F04DRAFT_1059627 [Mycena alexandri]|uniref:Uncharacterized protein n=1 Tax=Mycena alexandri TaxID=1745969 RepID=A0AAD6XCT1_9AGAR|nr:hypothetical protein C8F04DRAFT_1059627 [Mycena alexandri]